MIELIGAAAVDQPRDEGGRYDTTGQSPHAAEGAVAKELGLPSFYHGSDSKTKFVGYSVDNPLPKSTKVSFEEAQRIPILQIGETKDLPIADLRSTQDYIQPSAVQHYMTGAYMKSRPLVATVHGEHVVLNGNHNVLAEKLKGSSTITVQHIGDVTHHVERIKGEPRMRMEEGKV